MPSSEPPIISSPDPTTIQNGSNVHTVLGVTLSEESPLPWSPGPFSELMPCDRLYGCPEGCTRHWNLASNSPVQSAYSTFGTQQQSGELICHNPERDEKVGEDVAKALTVAPYKVLPSPPLTPVIKRRPSTRIYQDSSLRHNVGDDDDYDSDSDLDCLTQGMSSLSTGR